MCHICAHDPSLSRFPNIADSSPNPSPHDGKTNFNIYGFLPTSEYASSATFITQFHMRSMIGQKQHHGVPLQVKILKKTNDISHRSTHLVYVVAIPAWDV